MNRKQAQAFLQVFNLVSNERGEELAYRFIEDLLGNEGFGFNKEVWRYYAEGGEIEMKYGSKWIEVYDPSFNPDVKYRKAKPQTYMLFGIEVEGEPPMTEPPTGRAVWLLDSWDDRGISSFVFDGNKSDLILMKRGLIWANKEGVLAAAKALGWYQEDE